MIRNPIGPFLRGRDLARLCLLLVLVALVVAMSGCGAMAPQLVEIRVPLPVGCPVDTPARPAMPTEALQRSAPLDAKVKAALAEIELREGYEIELVAALDACTKPVPSD